MTKTERVDGIAKSAAITKKADAVALDLITIAITKELKKGNNVVIPASVPPASAIALPATA